MWVEITNFSRALCNGRLPDRKHGAGALLDEFGHLPSCVFVCVCVCVYLLGGLQLRVQQCGGSSLRRDGSLLAVARRDGSAITQRRPVSQQLIKLSLRALPDYLIDRRRTSQDSHIQMGAQTHSHTELLFRDRHSEVAEVTHTHLCVHTHTHVHMTVDDLYKC